MGNTSCAEMTYYDKFYNYLNELLGNYSKLAVLLKQKLEALAKFDVGALDSIIKEEQVYVLISKSFDSHVQSYRDKLSLSGGSLSDVIEELPEDQKPRYREVFVKLKAKLEEVKILNEKCQLLIEERLYSIEKSIRHLDKSSAAVYGKPGAKQTPPADPHILKTSV